MKKNRQLRSRLQTLFSVAMLVSCSVLALAEICDAQNATPSPTACSTRARARLLAHGWNGNGPGGAIHIFNFREDGTLSWQLLTGDVWTEYRAKYRLDDSRTPHRIELIELDPPMQSSNLKGLLEFQANGSARLDFSARQQKGDGREFSPEIITLHPFPKYELTSPTPRR